ncbi:hypothetical protein LRP88_11600 [Fusarium phalaenopsidis]
MRLSRKKRARQACLSCNARRVKCDRLERNPCTHCANADTPCVLRESRRGKHPRKPREPRPRETDLEPGSHTRDTALPGLEESGSDLGLSSTPVTHGSDGSSVPAVASHHNTTTETPTGVTDAGATSPVRQVWEDHIVASQVLAGLSQYDIAEQTWPHAPPDQTLIRAAPSSTTRQDPSPEGVSSREPGRQDDEETVFLGESTSIRYLHDAAHSSPAMPATTQQRFLYPVPEAVRAATLTSEWAAERRQARIRLLEAEGAFSFPTKSAVEKLLMAYFRWFHTCFAIVDEPDIWQEYQQGTLSPLLLQALLFIGVTHCEEENLVCVGLGSRQRAKYIFYNRAKDLFDAEIEPKALIVIQALFLLSFWRAGALLQKDTRHWLGAAVSLAQTKALHRSPRGAQDEVQRLRKRIWWSIYIRERQCAAALGLPNRVRDEDCDIETLCDKDFESAFGPSMSPTQVQESISYMICLVELSRILGRIIHHDFLPLKHLTGAKRGEIREYLLQWRSKLPTQMRMDGLENTPSFHASMLHLAYNNLLILLYRSRCGQDGAHGGGVDGQVALQAAARNTSIIESMLTESCMCHGQIHVITNIFNTLCIHTLSLRFSEGSRRYVTEHRAKLCLLALQELQKTWEVKNWILQVFFQYLDRPTAARLQLGEDWSEGVPAPRLATETHPPPATSPWAPPESHSQDAADVTDTTGATASEGPWNMSTADVEHFLYSQIENRFVNREGGAIDWYMADLIETALPS